jgi:hypothetical protein
MIPVEWAMIGMSVLGAFGFIMGWMANERRTSYSDVDIYE